jgi:hypothetical protein
MNHQSKELGFAGHMSAAIKILNEVIEEAGEHEQEDLKRALALLYEGDNIVWRVDADRLQDKLAAEAPLADKCIICDGALTEENVAKTQRDIHADCHERML